MKQKMRTRKQKMRLRTRSRKYSQRGGGGGEIGEACGSRYLGLGDTCKEGIKCVDNKCTPYTPDDYMPALVQMIVNQNGPAVSYLISLDPSLVNQTTILNDGLTWTPLTIAAASSDNAAIIKSLMDTGANATAKNETGDTPLIIASKHGYLETVRALIESNADIGLNEHNENYNTALMIAATANNVALVDALLEAGAKADIKDGAGKTVLMLASALSLSEMVSILLRKAPGILNAQDTTGRTALMHAIDSPGIFHQLLTAGADTEKKTFGPRTYDLNTQRFVSRPGQSVASLAAENPIASQLLNEPDASKREIILQSAAPSSRVLFNRARTNASTLLGAGGFGTVRSVVKNGKRVAAKRVVFDKYAIKGDDINPSERSNYNVEVGALKHLKGNPYVLQFIEGESYNQNAYMITEQLEGMTLSQAMNKGKINDSNIRAVVKQLVHGLDSIHAEGVIHLDIKPNNLWFTPGSPPRIKYFDFGLSCRVIPCTKKDNIGTEGYALEARKTADGNYYFDKKNDYYALKVTLEKLKPYAKSRENKEFLDKTISELTPKLLP